MARASLRGRDAIVSTIPTRYNAADQQVGGVRLAQPAQRHDGQSTLTAVPNKRGHEPRRGRGLVDLLHGGDGLLGGRRSSAFITKVEKAKNTPPDKAAPMMATRVNVRV
jgi:hypothetical protein